MKKLTLVLAAATALVSAPALAADLRMPVKAPAAVAPVPYFNWSGCYIGAHGGGAWGDKRWRDPAVLGGFEFARHDVDGFLAGGQVGCDWQTGAFVFGVEGSASWADLSGSSLDLLSPGGITLRDHSKVDFLGTITGRIGWAWDRTLLYVKGGGAVAHDRFRATCDNVVLAGTACTGQPAGTLFYSSDDSRWGWTVGAGIEWAFTPNWSAKLEYNYMDFGRERFDFGGGRFAALGGTVASFDIEQRIHVVKAGINYRFNFGGPLVASY
jgi:outer membrane immunogenic protein